MAIVSFNIEVTAEFPITINEADLADGTYLDLIGDAVQAFMENNDMNALDYQYKVLGDVIGSD
jgi:hypothetical protein